MHVLFYPNKLIFSWFAYSVLQETQRFLTPFSSLWCRKGRKYVKVKILLKLECGFSFLFWIVKGWCSEIQISFCSFIVPEVLVVFIISKRNFRSLVIPLPKWHFIVKRNSRKACSRKILQFVWYNRGYYFLLLLKHATRNIFRVIMSPKFLGDYRMPLFFFLLFLVPHSSPINLFFFKQWFYILRKILLK